MTSQHKKQIYNDIFERVFKVDETLVSQQWFLKNRLMRWLIYFFRGDSKILAEDVITVKRK